MLTLRESIAGDLDGVVAMEAQEDTARWLGTTGHEWHRQAMVDRGQEHLVAESGGSPTGDGGERLIGFAVFAGIGSTEIELRRMVLAAGERGTGRGRELLRALIARAYQVHGARLLWLDVKVNNHRARALYESESFTAVRTLPGAPSRDDGSISDLLVMVHGPGSR